MSAPRVLITGASRGIGLALCEGYLSLGWQVVATARDPDVLASLAERSAGALQCVMLDVTDGGSVRAARGQCGDGPIDVLINNAGMTGGPQRAPGMDLLQAEMIMDVNAMGPLRVYDSFVDLVQRSARGRIVNISSEAGSLSAFRASSKPEYAMSKAALNALTRWQASVETKLVCVSLHPGWVKTAMGGEVAPTEPAEAADRLIKAIDWLGPEHSGGFFDAELNPIPW